KRRSGDDARAGRGDPAVGLTTTTRRRRAMRKRVIKPAAGEGAAVETEWLDVEGLAQVEVTSEDAAHPIESALVPGHEGGWRGAPPGGAGPRARLCRRPRVRRPWRPP